MIVDGSNLNLDNRHKKYCKIRVFENSQYMPDFLGFQNMMILNLHGILFHVVVVFEPEHDLLFKPVSTYCAVVDSTSFQKSQQKKH